MSILFLIHTIIIYAVVFHVGYFIAKKFNKLSIVDIFWGLGPLFCGLDGYFNVGEKGAKSWALASLSIIWGLRLALHLLWRSQNQPEDKRYTALRQEWGTDVWAHAYKKIFLAQAGLNLILTIPLWSHFGKDPTPEKLTVLSAIGIITAIAGLTLETYADFVLTVFVKLKRQGKAQGFCQVWPWNKARHPNYLGEMVFWWGVALISFDGPRDLWMCASPLLVMALLIKGTGVPLLEKEFANRAGYQDYQQGTKRFLPF